LPRKRYEVSHFQSCNVNQLSDANGLIFSKSNSQQPEAVAGRVSKPVETRCEVIEGKMRLDGFSDFQQLVRPGVLQVQDR
jgi:hypothetical protein